MSMLEWAKREVEIASKRESEETSQKVIGIMVVPVMLVLWRRLR